MSSMIEARAVRNPSACPCDTMTTYRVDFNLSSSSFLCPNYRVTSVVKCDRCTQWYTSRPISAFAEQVRAVLLRALWGYKGDKQL
jgi:hypothetical protein